MVIDTARLRLRSWRESDRTAFATLHADAQVMWDLGGPLDARTANAKFDRYVDGFAQRGYGRLIVETADCAFIGYCGVQAARADHLLGAHSEIGWRLRRAAWGRGYASEAARAALSDAFTRVGLPEVLSYTAPDNLRSQAVMARLGLTRDPARDFTFAHDGAAPWRGLVWFARP